MKLELNTRDKSGDRNTYFFREEDGSIRNINGGTPVLVFVDPTNRYIYNTDGSIYVYPESRKFLVVEGDTSGEHSIRETDKLPKSSPDQPDQEPTTRQPEEGEETADEEDGSFAEVLDQPAPDVEYPHTVIDGGAWFEEGHDWIRENWLATLGVAVAAILIAVAMWTHACGEKSATVTGHTDAELELALDEAMKDMVPVARIEELRTKLDEATSERDTLKGRLAESGEQLTAMRSKILNKIEASVSGATGDISQAIRVAVATDAAKRDKTVKQAVQDGMAEETGHRDRMLREEIKTFSAKVDQIAAELPEKVADATVAKMRALRGLPSERTKAWFRSREVWCKKYTTINADGVRVKAEMSGRQAVKMAIRKRGLDPETSWEKVTSDPLTWNLVWDYWAHGGLTENTERYIHDNPPEPF